MQYHAHYQWQWSARFVDKESRYRMHLTDVNARLKLPVIFHVTRNKKNWCKCRDNNLFSVSQYECWISSSLLFLFSFSSLIQWFKLIRLYMRKIYLLNCNFLLNMRLFPYNWYLQLIWSCARFILFKRTPLTYIKKYCQKFSLTSQPELFT